MTIASSPEWTGWLAWPVGRLDTLSRLAGESDPRDMMQPQARQPASLELADRRLVEAGKGFHLPLRQPGPMTPFAPFRPNPSQLLVDFGSTSPLFAIHGSN
jgi:hypothetical protein